MPVIHICRSQMFVRSHFDSFLYNLFLRGNHQFELARTLHVGISIERAEILDLARCFIDSLTITHKMPVISFRVVDKK